jgi:hypothetical protein
MVKTALENVINYVGGDCFVPKSAQGILHHHSILKASRFAWQIRFLKYQKFGTITCCGSSYLLALLLQTCLKIDLSG